MTLLYNCLHYPARIACLNLAVGSKEKNKMAKIQRNFRINPDLDSRLKEIAKAEGITVSQLVELACFAIADEKKSIPKPDPKRSNRDKRISVYMRTESKTYKKLQAVSAEKNTTLSQEINYRLRASLTNSKFDLIEMRSLSKAMIDLNRLGGLFKLSLNNGLNNPELLEDLNKKVMEIRDYFRETVIKSLDRN